MAAENKLQTEIIKWLKSKGAYVIKTRPAPGIPVGCPDIIFLFEGAWGAIEVKASKTAKMQSLQPETLIRLSRWSPFVYKCYPENWGGIKAELSSLFF
jgi:Holliday junction resolvase